MPRVGYYENQGRLRNLPGTASPDFSPQARAGAAVGAAAGELGRGVATLGQVAARLQARKDDDEATTAFNEYRERLTGAVVGRTGDDGAFVPGLAKRTLRDAAGISAEGGRTAREIGEDIAGRLTSDAARRLFDERRTPLTQGYLTRLADIEADESRKARSLAHEAGAEGALDGAAAAWDDDDLFGLQVAHGEAELAAGLELGGVPAEVAQERRKAYRGKAEARRFDAAAASGDWGRAETVLKASRDMTQEQRDRGMATLAAGRRAAEAEAARAQAAMEKELVAEAGAVKFRFFRGEIGAAEALAQGDALFTRGLPGEKALDVREFVGKAAEAAKAAAELEPTLFAASGRGDTSAYLALSEAVAAGREPWRTEESLLAAAQSGALTEAQFNRLYADNRAGLDGKAQQAVRAALAGAAGLTPADVDAALDRTSEAGRKARDKLMGRLAYDYDRPWRIDWGDKGITAEEFDALVDGARAFLDAHPDKDVLKDYVEPALRPKADRLRALTLAERLSLGRAELNGALEAARAAKDLRVSQMAARDRAARERKAADDGR